MILPIFSPLPISFLWEISFTASPFHVEDSWSHVFISVLFSELQTHNFVLLNIPLWVSPLTSQIPHVLNALYCLSDLPIFSCITFPGWWYHHLPSYPHQNPLSPFLSLTPYNQRVTRFGQSFYPHMSQNFSSSLSLIHTVFVCSNERMGGFNNKFIFLQFWKLEVWDQVVSRADFLLRSVCLVYK